ANNDTALTAQDMAITITVLGNDSDPDGDAIKVTSVSQPSHGSATNNVTTITYTPAPGYYGVDSFTYNISDIHGAISAPATVALTVNRPPQVNAGPNQTVTIAAGAKLAGSVTDDGYPVGGTL